MNNIVTINKDDIMYTYENATDYYYYLDEQYAPCDNNVIHDDNKITISVIYCLLFILGLSGNMLVIYVLTSCRKLKTVTDIFLINLAISDLLFVMSFPFQIHYQLDQWIFGNFTCKIVSGFYYVGFYSGMFFVTVMSVHRYISIVHVAYSLKIKNIKTGYVVSLSVWILAIILTTPLIVVYQVEKHHDTLICYALYDNKAFVWKLFINFEINVIGMLIPLVILLYCYIKILIRLKKYNNKSKLRAIKLVLIIVLLNILFWIPFNVVLFLTSMQSLGFLNGCEIFKKITYALYVTGIISSSHCCINPIIYSLAGEKFNCHLYNMIVRFKRASLRSSTSSSKSTFSNVL
ncbi:7L [Yaba monkey tumor virus]|uniref:7L n=1 Tax=Yaba monkey tumor virus (strain VR587) TaxID=928314 RepID=Q6TV00_YMTV5|nr:G protein-coupled chemokine receptor-like protein [Yaba monkey tumor virus]AAR07369.1 7L [Yaba monkey tumor virus]